MPEFAEVADGLQMPLADAMQTQRAVRRLRSDPVDDETVLDAAATSRCKAPTGQQRPELGVRRRPGPRREAPARPAQPPGLVDLPPVRPLPGPRRPQPGPDPRRGPVAGRPLRERAGDRGRLPPRPPLARRHGQQRLLRLDLPGGPEPPARGPGPRPRRRAHHPPALVHAAWPGARSASPATSRPAR